jgi:hypothetical protein
MHKIPQTNYDPISGWSQQTTDIGILSYRYAQMSNNAYRPDNRNPPPYDMGPDIIGLDAKDNDDVGFAYAVFEWHRLGAKPQVVIAYRGTENDTPVDWYDGTLLNRQAPRALKVFDDWRARRPDADIIVTGHSLGGGLAINVSLHREHVAAYVFNTSPRFSKGQDRIANDRYSIVEYGEVLKITRIFAREANQIYTSINCSSGINVIKQHSMRRLANCLTQIAAWKLPEAKASLAINNIEFPKGMPR